MDGRSHWASESDASYSQVSPSKPNSMVTKSPYTLARTLVQMMKMEIITYVVEGGVLSCWTRRNMICGEGQKPWLAAGPAVPGPGGRSRPDGVLAFFSPQIFCAHGIAVETIQDIRTGNREREGEGRARPLTFQKTFISAKLKNSRNFYTQYVGMVPRNQNSPRFCFQGEKFQRKFED